MNQTMSQNEIDIILKKCDELFNNNKDIKAVNLLQSIKESQSLEYHWRMGEVYQHGYGLKKDYIQSIIHYEKAANLGDVKWFSEIANIYRRRREYEKSIKYLKKAAKFKQMQSLFHLGNFYEYGKGVKRNVKKAKYYYYKAAKEGHAFSKGKIIKYMVLGEFGLIKRLCGFVLVPIVFIEISVLLIFNKNSKRFDGFE